MALPTFDFGNLARISLGLILYTVKSPIFYFSTLIISFGIIFNQLYQYFIGISIPSIAASLAMPTNQSGGVTTYFIYMFNVETLLQIFNGFISILNSIISFVPGMLLGLIIAMRLYSGQKHLYQTVKDISKQS